QAGALRRLLRGLRRDDRRQHGRGAAAHPRVARADAALGRSGLERVAEGLDVAPVSLPYELARLVVVVVGERRARAAPHVRQRGVNAEAATERLEIVTQVLVAADEVDEACPAR